MDKRYETVKMGSEQLLLRWFKGHLLPSLKKHIPVQENAELRRVIYTRKDDIMIFYRRKRDGNGTYDLKRNMIIFYQVKLLCSKSNEIKRLH